jgi:hypothetical protein
MGKWAKTSIFPGDFSPKMWVNLWKKWGLLAQITDPKCVLLAGLGWGKTWR